MKKKPITTQSVIKSAIRNLWMRSRERAFCLKEHGYRCSVCGIKQSKAKGHEVSVEVHHIQPIDWPELIAEIKRTLLNPENLMPVCKNCHKKIHENDENKWQERD